MNIRTISRCFAGSLFFLIGSNLQAVDPPPEVEVCKAVVREISDYQDFTGRVEASTTVTIKPRVGGLIVSGHFKEGATVKK